MPADTDIRVKLCGLKTEQDVAVAASCGASYVGFVFFPKSPRNLDVKTAARLASSVSVGVAKVALVVDPTDAFLDQILDAVPLDMIQLHGKEDPDHVLAIKQRSGLPVMKALGVANSDDIKRARIYAEAADQLLLDGKPVSGGLPGGNGLAFDWTLLQGQKFSVPWMLAGGLDASNVAAAIKLTGARQVDVSSGIETEPGLKDAAKMQAFVSAAQGE